MTSLSWTVPSVCVAILLSSCGCQNTVNSNGENRVPSVNADTESIRTKWPLPVREAQALQTNEARRAEVPCFSRLDLGEGVFVDLVFVPPGAFPMGSRSVGNNPPRIVKISKGFLLGKCEIVWRQFLSVVNTSDMMVVDQERVKAIRARKELELPADVDYLLAEKFCKELSAAKGIRVRLPTEAEWEYACRAGTTALYGEWDAIDDTKANVCQWVGPDGKEVFSRRKEQWLVPVGQYKGNRWGVHDMLGNADEWCLDSYSDRIDLGTLPTVDPLARKGDGLFRVVRGGSFNLAQTVFYRAGDATTAHGRGIRIVVEVDEQSRARCIDAVPPDDRNGKDLEAKRL